MVNKRIQGLSNQRMVNYAINWGRQVVCHSKSAQIFQLLIPNLSNRGGGLVQGWESVCWGVGEFPSLKIKKSKCLGFSVSWSPGFLVALFLGFLVSSSFQSSKDPKFQRCTDSRIPFHVFDRYWSHITKLPFHVFWKMLIPYSKNMFF